MKKITGLNLEQTYLTLNESMFSILEPNTNITGEIVLLNKSLLKKLDISDTALKTQEGIHFLTGTTDVNGTLYAQAYAGHQYGHFTMLGDGRAMNLGEVYINEKYYDLQLKGSGKTPYSRGGDGKATLYSMLREYLISEAMNYLNIDTTRSLAVLKTNEKIKRETYTQAGILCRVAGSHIRVGTFEYANASGGVASVKELADYSINRHYPHLNESKNKYADFLSEVIKKQATLIAKWQSIGFVHGVMNTDNMTISGETIDYGPCAFLDQYIPSKSFSSIDQNGRYSYINQPNIGSWNLARFAETMLELLSEDMKQAVELANTEIQQYKEYFMKEYYDIMAKKIGIIDPTPEEKVLIDELLKIMEKNEADYTNTFYFLTIDEYNKLSFYNTEEWKQWFRKWTRFLGTRNTSIVHRTKLMEQHNPVIIPRNFLVEETLLKASNENDYTLFNELLNKITKPFDYRILHEKKYTEPIESDLEYVTYCGT